MKKQKIERAVDACRAFLDAVEAIDERAKVDDNFARFMEITGFTETGTLRRRSMDLTRALADLRRSN